MNRVRIIGAGPAGLTAAYELSRLGVEATVLEADDQVGGLSRTLSYRGYRFDIGGHRFYSKVPLINELWHEILGEDFLSRPRVSRIYYRDHFFDYPLRPMNALAGLGPLEAMRVVLSYAHARAFPHERETNFEQWVSNRFGQRLFDIFFRTYTEKVWGMPCSEISADWAAQRIRSLSLQEAVVNAIIGSRNGSGATSLIESFHYPRHGPGMMWERCQRVLGERGVQTVRGVQIDRIRHSRGRVEAVEGRAGDGRRLDFDGEQFISTMALSELIHALDPPPPAEVLDAANNLRYRDYLTVALIINRESIFPDNWIYIHAPEVKVGRIQNYKNWSPEMVPDQSRTALGLEYFLWGEDEMWRWPDERLIDFGMKECNEIGLLEAGDVEDGKVVRVKKAYPIYDHNYQRNVATLRRYLETLPNLQTIGRNGLHRYNNQDHSMLTGIYAARNIAGERLDVWSVNTEMEYHEDTVGAGERGGDRMVPLGVTPSGAPEEIMQFVFARLDPVALGAAIGVISGLGLFLATAVLLLKGGRVVGPTLSLLSQYLPGFAVTWSGAFIGLVEAGASGFMIGYGGAWLRNRVMGAFAYVTRRRAQSREDKELLDKL
jgi:protoporphyrinogen oxidase